MSDKSDHSGQEEQSSPIDEASRRPRYVPYPQMTDLHSSERGLYRVVPGIPTQTISAERTRTDIHTFPFNRVPTRGIPTAMEPPVNAVPPTFGRARIPGYSFSSPQTLPLLSSSATQSRPPIGVFHPPLGLRSSGGASASGSSGGPPPYWQHIGEPRNICTPPRGMNSLLGAGHRTTVPLPSVQDIFSPAASAANEDLALPPIFMSPSVYCHMRDADPASAVDAGVGRRVRSRSRSPESIQSRGSDINPEPERERARNEEPASPEPSSIALATRARQRPLAPAEPPVQVPGPSAILTEFQTVEAHTAKCDVCNKRNGQGMTRCMECGWQSCNACTIKNNCFRSHRSGVELHVGPIEKKSLPTAASLKKSKLAAKRKREDPDYVPDSEKGSKKKKKQRATKSQVRTTGNASKPSSSSHHDGSPNDADSVDLSEAETILDAAQSLYAMSLEAFEMEARARTSKFRKRWQYSLWMEHDNDDDGRNGVDDTESMSTDSDSDYAEPSSPLARCIPRLRREALEIAQEEAKFYRRLRINQATASGMNLDDETESASESESESEKLIEKVKTRAQTYARKRSGR